MCVKELPHIPFALSIYSVSQESRVLGAPIQGVTSVPMVPFSLDHVRKDASFLLCFIPFCYALLSLLCLIGPNSSPIRHTLSEIVVVGHKYLYLAVFFGIYSFICETTSLEQKVQIQKKEDKEFVDILCFKLLYYAFYVF